MSFDVLTIAKPASTWVLESSVPAELIVPGDARFETLIKQQILADPNADISLSEAMSAFEINEPVALTIESYADFDIYYTDRFGGDYHNSLGVMASKDGEFFDKLLNGVYNICVVNKSKKSSAIKIIATTKNVRFLQGAGDGWSNSLIQADNSISSPQCPIEAWWLQVRIEHPPRLQPPYSANCGAVGPRPSKTDKRFCRELPNGSGSTLTRDFVIGDGSLSTWFTSRCGMKPVPDAISITVDGPFTINDLVLCRVAPNAYSGGFNIGSEKRSIQIIIEQLEPVEVIPGQTTNLVGGNNYRCTMLGWNTNDCIGDISNFGSVIAVADCDNWSLDGIWSMAGIDIKFNAKAVENLAVDDNVELVLNIDESNTGFYKGVSVDLPKGEYVVDITDCCFRSGEQYTGHIEIEYQSVNGQTVKRFPNLGAYADEDVARSNYRGLTIEISHQGGAVSAKLVSPVLLDGSGKISVRFTTKDSFVQSDQKITQLEDTCAISYAQVRMMEDWQSSTNSGIVVDLAGQDYIITQQYIDGMQACVEKYDRPSFAWPTLDGVHFANIPDSGIVSFKRVLQLEAIAKTVIKNVNINTILFPIIS